jgi:hypothetical protein
MDFEESGNFGISEVMGYLSLWYLVRFSCLKDRIFYVRGTLYVSPCSFRVQHRHRYRKVKCGYPRIARCRRR